MILFVFAGALFIAAGALFVTAGDIFLSFIGNEIHIGISYGNHSGLIDCFVRKRINLEAPVFLIKDFDLALGSQSALIRPDFTEALDKKTITLKCSIKNASLLHVKDKIKDTDDIAGFFGGKTSQLLDRLANVLFDTIDGELRIFGETLEFRSLKAVSNEIKLTASGSVTESGSINLSLEVFFAPDIVATFPDELKAMLKAEATGWFSYRIKLANSASESIFKLETDMFRVEFKEVVEH